MEHPLKGAEIIKNIPSLSETIDIVMYHHERMDGNGYPEGLKGDDIPLLVNFYIDRISRRLGKDIKMVPAGVMDTLRQYHWPGNVRELENVLERAVINSSGPKLRLVDELKIPRKDTPWPDQTLEHVERDYIKRVLEQTGWKVSGKNSAAEILGLERSTLRARMRKLNIRKP